MSPDPYGLGGLVDELDTTLGFIAIKATAMKEDTLRGRDAMSAPTMEEMERAAYSIGIAAARAVRLIRTYKRAA